VSAAIYAAGRKCRERLQAVEAVQVMPHPCTFGAAHVEVLLAILVEHDAGRVVGDPFAGTGGIHGLNGHGYITRGVELEEEWAAAHPDTQVGDATDLPWCDGVLDVVATSPAWGNRMADHHEARDDSHRQTYRHLLGRTLSDGNSGGMQWGDDYRQLHRLAWAESRRVVRPGGLIVVNIGNHVRAGVEQLVSEWHLGTLLALDLQLLEARPMQSARYRRGANGQARPDHEWWLVLRKPTGGR